jgi:hypothetical protein
MPPEERRGWINIGDSGLERLSDRPLELLLGTAGGAVLGLGVELFSLLLTSACYDVLVDTGECNEDWGKAAGIGAAAGASWVLISYAIWPRDWKNVTKHYPSAGGDH